MKGVDKRTDSVIIAKLLDTKMNDETTIEHEKHMLGTMRHERICGLIAGYRKPDSQAAALVLEKLQGADILTYLSSKKEYSEQTVATIVTQVSSVLVGLETMMFVILYLFSCVFLRFWMVCNTFIGVAIVISISNPITSSCAAYVPYKSNSSISVPARKLVN